MSTLALNQIQRAKQTRATFLDLGNCGLTTLPTALLELSWLERLNLGPYYYDENKRKWLESVNTGIRNALTTGSLAEITQLAQLQSLDLSYNNLTDISVLAKLPQLQTLNLSSTKISDISPILALVRSGLPVKWSSYTWEGAGIYVEDCFSDNLPTDILKQGNEAIVNFFDQVEKQGGTVPLFEAKLIMVGEPGSGKTSLTEKLVDESHQVRPEDPSKKSTLGINIKENWRFVDPKRPAEYFTSHIWDFGGQEIQYMTHQFFLTPESLYVLVADDRKQHTLFPYWFEVIHLLGTDEAGNISPILVVLNERNHKSITNFDLNEYRRKYPQTRIDVLEVDLADVDLSRFRALRDKIHYTLCSLSHVGRPLPRMWSPIREAILERNATQNHISEREFAEICAEYNVREEADRRLISKYLHQLGIILHFQHDIQLRDFIIIKPSWALKAVYAVLEDTKVQKGHGQFTEDDLETYWKELTTEERVKILNLMRRDSFEICYPVGNQTYIAPQLLPNNRPTFPWDSKESLKFHFFYRFMPKGIMTRLIVRKHEDLADKERVWARGGVFSRFNCTILVTEEETEQNGLIAIEVTGPSSYQRDALTFIRTEIEDIHRKWFSNIEYDERAPCNCADCVKSEKPTFFNWNDLRQRVEENRRTIECGKGRVKDVPVFPLLEGIYDKERVDNIQRARQPTQDYIIKDSRASRRSSVSIPPANAEPIKEEPVLESQPPIMKNTENISLRVAAIGALVALVFFAFAKSNSEFDFMGIFYGKQGHETPAQKPTADTKSETPVTVTGRIRINNRNASAEDVKQVYIKDQTTVQPVMLANNTFTLRNVDVPSDKLITIAIDLKNGSSPSQQFRLPKPKADNVVDLGEVLLEVRQSTVIQRSTGKRSSPTVIINNQNIQRN